MITVDLNPKLLLFYSEKADGNVDERFGSSRDTKAARNAILTPHHLNMRDVIEAAQIHSDRILVLNSENSKMWKGVNVTGVDGFITREPSVALMIKVADCVPVVLYDPENHAVALVHAGFKGTVQGIVKTAISKMQTNYKTDPKKVLVWLGPSIRSCHYHIDSLPENLDEASWQPYLKKTKGQYQVDLIGFIKQSLHDEGVLKKFISDSDICTAESDNLFSHQRSVTTGEPEGRFTVVVKLR